MHLEGDEKEEKFNRLDQVLAVYGRDPEQLIRVLQEAQHIFGYLPEEVQAYISQQDGYPGKCRERGGYLLRPFLHRAKGEI
ncbi:hypothetical protein [Desulfotomaculum nigrificans]|uniref:hypothetical protein n=1 Tax=Desulfotomaculum nigrificans TaxID=1565 RepID=UPI0002F55584|nr:hypothetical protein [Desulfotomaculum nigrificans]